MTVAVRAATPADGEAIAAIYAPHVVEGYSSFEAEPPSAAEFGARMGARPRLPWLVAEEGGVVLGYAYAGRHRTRAAYRWAVDVSVYVAPGAQGRGIGRALYEQLLAEVRALGYVSAFAGITLPNPASVGLHEALGFVPVGVYRDVGFKLGKWWDVGWWQLRLRQLPPAPDEPREWQPAG